MPEHERSVSTDFDTRRTADPFLRPAFSLKNRLARATWTLVDAVAFKPSPKPLHRWRAFILRAFGAKIGKDAHIYPRARIWAPWNLECEAFATIADGAVVYNPRRVTLRSHAIVSQDAYLCGATHDHNHPDFPLTAAPIEIGRFGWVAARAAVLPGVRVGDGAVLGLNSVATKDLEAWTVYGGLPAKPIGRRNKRASE